MAKGPPDSRKKAKDEEERGGGWKPWVRDIAIAILIMVVILGAIFAYTGVWPPLVVVESSSMQHSGTQSYVGVIDTGDLVFVQAAPTRADVITYVQGRATGYATYGDYGDVIIFREYNDPSATPIIHRAIMYAIPNGTTVGAAFADVPDLKNLNQQDWQGVDANGFIVHTTYHLQSVTIFNMGYMHLNITFDFERIVQFNPALWTRGGGYLTMGDHNAPSYDTSWFPIQGDLIGHARGEIPWFGLIKLILSPAQRGCCPQGWGDPLAPANSWTDLLLSLIFLVALPFILEGIGWAWGKYAWPRIEPHMPRLLRRKGGPARDEPEDTGTADGPREGSSGP